MGVRPGWLNLQVRRRDAYVQDLRLAAGAPGDPTVARRVRTARPGKQGVADTAVYAW
jgi:hypothetical protein